MLVLIDCNDDTVARALLAGAKQVGADVQLWNAKTRSWSSSDKLLLITDGDTGSLIRHAADLQVRQVEPKRTLVHAHAPRQHTWVYHDLPLFASILAPRTDDDASAVIRRLTRARTYHHSDYSPSFDFGRRGIGPEAQTSQGEIDRALRVSALTDLKVLLIGETGTGKNTFAARIHELSGRPGSFVALNCAALPESLLESELFGAEPGAFTGAQRSRPGRFELADRGTLFLDEIDSLPMHLQGKLLGAIQDSGTTRLGDNRFRPSQFRLITAAQTPLPRLVAAGTFRSDLMHRVSVIEIVLPPIRSLGSQLIGVFEEMLAAERARLNLPEHPVEAKTYVALLGHDWPGNYRELAAAAQRYAVGLPLLNAPAMPPQRPGLKNQMLEVERTLVRRALQTHGGNLRATSEELGLPLETLRYRLRLLGLKEPSGKGGK
jgi:DNA-binding NtrC family response regulator